MTRRKPTSAVRTRWPAETPAALNTFYGRHELTKAGNPTQRWLNANLTTFASPYPMVASWNPRIVITRIQCHRRVAASLERVLQGILDHYGSVASVRSARMHLYGGVYAFRRISGSSRLSLHAYGAGIDLDPEQNPLGREWRPDRGMMPLEVVALFEREGWKWGGRFRGRKDCMHFQATR